MLWKTLAQEVEFAEKEKSKESKEASEEVSAEWIPELL